MEYADTWFGQHPMSIFRSENVMGRPYFLHRNILLRQDVITPGFLTGTRDKKALQRSLLNYATELSRDGAIIVKLTRNTLTARHERETLKVEISDIKRPRL